MSTPPTILVLGATGKTGRRLLPRLRAAGVTARGAARSGADVHFDWDDVETHHAALDSAGAVYLVPPALRAEYTEQAIDFLDRAEAAGVEHVTLLSARGVDQAPPEASARAVELDLAGRRSLTHTVLRPGWFMENFSEGVLQPPIAGDGIIPMPSGDGAEAFISADDIADAAAASLLDPTAHAGAGYTLTGPEALTMAAAAERISATSGRTVRHLDVPRAAFVDSIVAAGVPGDYAGLLADLVDGAMRHGAGAAITEDVLRATGHPPRSFDDYLAGVDPAAWSARAA